MHKHRSEAWAFNQDWNDFLLDSSNLDFDKILAYARKLAKQYGYKVNF